MCSPKQFIYSSFYGQEFSILHVLKGKTDSSLNNICMYVCMYYACVSVNIYVCTFVCINVCVSRDFYYHSLKYLSRLVFFFQVSC